MSGLTEDERRQAYTYATNGAEFMFIPSSHLKEMIARNDEIISGVAETFKIVMLSNNPIRIDNNMVISYCTKRLDTKNTFILDNGDIKVIPVSIKIDNFKKL
jgi:uncharacterized protein YlaI